jgi:hypothetical protein
MQHHGVDAREEEEAPRHVIVDVLQDAPHFALRRLDVGAEERCARRSRKLRRQVAAVDGLNERALAARAHGHRLDHRYADGRLKRGAIQAKAALLGEIAHVERHDQRLLQALQIEHEPQVQTQIGRIDHAHQKIGRGLARMAAEDDVARDGLIEARSLEAVGAGQIEYAIDAAARGTYEAAFLSLDGDAGIVRDLLATAREAVEEGCLTAVRDADQRKARASRRGLGVHVE